MGQTMDKISLKSLFALWITFVTVSLAHPIDSDQMVTYKDMGTALDSLVRDDETSYGITCDDRSVILLRPIKVQRPTQTPPNVEWKGYDIPVQFNDIHIHAGLQDGTLGLSMDYYDYMFKSELVQGEEEESIDQPEEYEYDWESDSQQMDLLNSSLGIDEALIFQRKKRQKPLSTSPSYRADTELGVKGQQDSFRDKLTESMKSIIFIRCPFYPCPEGYVCDFQTHTCRALFFPDYDDGVGVTPDGSPYESTEHPAQQH